MTFHVINDRTSISDGQSQPFSKDIGAIGSRVTRDGKRGGK
jgi:hypothetical protein